MDFYFILIILFLPLFLYGFISQNFSEKSNSLFLGLTTISLSLCISRTLRAAFFNQKLKHPKIINENNFAEFLDFETAKAVQSADEFARSSKLPLANSTVLFYFLLEKTSGLEFVFSRDLLSLNEIKSALKNQVREYR